MTSVAAPEAGLIIGTAGHVDHGKTTLVKALTGVDTDRLKEEKKRGLTIDLGFAPLRFDDGLAASIVDVPGHERFIRNMLAGATGMDLALLVVAADDGVMPQTVEHAEILDLLGVSRCVAVLTKCDLVGRARIDEVRGAVSGLLKGTSLAGARFAGVSAATGEGVGELKALIRRELASSLTDGPRRGRDASRGRFRLPVDRSFAVPGFGTVVTGSVASGLAAKGDGLIRLPGGEGVRVRGIESLNAPVEAVGAGRRAALNITGLAHTEIVRGDVIAAPALSMAAGIRRVDCLFEFIGNRRAKAGAAVKGRGVFRVHHLTDEADATVRLAGKRTIESGARAFGRLFLKKPLLMLRGDRFVLRSPSANATIGGGVVLLPYLSGSAAPPLESAPGESDGPSDGLREGRRLLDYLFSQGNLAVEKTRLLIMLNRDETGFAPPEGYAIEGGFVVDLRRLEAVKKAMAAEAARFVVKNPLEGWMGEAALFKIFARPFCRSIGEAAGLALFGAVLDKMAACDGFIERKGGLVRARGAKGESAPGRTGAVPDGADEKTRKAVEAVAALFDRAGFTPPDMAELGGLPNARADVDAALAWLARSGAIVKLKHGRFVAASSVEKAREVLLKMVAERGAIRAAEFRDALGCGRRAAIEMLEYFDAARLTLRRGDERVLRAP